MSTSTGAPSGSRPRSSTPRPTPLPFRSKLAKGPKSKPKKPTSGFMGLPVSGAAAAPGGYLSSQSSPEVSAWDRRASRAGEEDVVPPSQGRDAHRLSSTNKKRKLYDPEASFLDTLADEENEGQQEEDFIEAQQQQENLSHGSGKKRSRQMCGAMDMKAKKKPRPPPKKTKKFFFNRTAALCKSQDETTVGRDDFIPDGGEAAKRTPNFKKAQPVGTKRPLADVTNKIPAKKNVLPSPAPPGSAVKERPKRKKTPACYRDDFSSEEEDDNELEAAKEIEIEEEKKAAPGWHSSPLASPSTVFTCACSDDKARKSKDAGDVGRGGIHAAAAAAAAGIRTYGKKRLAADGDGLGNVSAPAPPPQVQAATKQKQGGKKEAIKTKDAKTVAKVGEKKKTKVQAGETLKKAAAADPLAKSAKKAGSRVEVDVAKEHHHQTVVEESDEDWNSGDEVEHLRGPQPREENEELILSGPAGDVAAQTSAVGDGSTSAHRHGKITSDTPLAESTRCEKRQKEQLSAAGGDSNAGATAKPSTSASSKARKLERALAANIECAIATVDKDVAGAGGKPPPAPRVAPADNSETPRTRMHATPPMTAAANPAAAAAAAACSRLFSSGADGEEDMSDRENVPPPKRDAGLGAPAPLSRYPRLGQVVVAVLDDEIDLFTRRIGKRITEAVLGHLD